VKILAHLRVAHLDVVRSGGQPLGALVVRSYAVYCPDPKSRRVGRETFSRRGPFSFLADRRVQLPRCPR
jgi:hypothetical protein